MRACMRACMVCLSVYVCSMCAYVLVCVGTCAVCVGACVVCVSCCCLSDVGNQFTLWRVWLKNSSTISDQVSIVTPIIVCIMK